MKGSRKIAEAAKVVEICKKIKQDYPNFELQAWHLNIDTEASQKLEQIKYDYQCYVQLYNKLHKQKLINDYFATEEGKDPEFLENGDLLANGMYIRLNGSDGSVAYITTYPCHICAKLLVSSGVREIVYDKDYPDELSKAFLEEAGIDVRKL